MNKKLYDTQFFKDNRSDKKLKSVEIVLSEVIKVLPVINSAVDFGCGVGTWLAGLQQLGVKEVRGMDGPWVKKELLTIPVASFVETNLEKEVILDKKYDLAVSIEVAEHLRKESAKTFIDSLTNASDIILFSAAIPFQGASANHVNEQWPDYWFKLLNERGYIAVDFLRKKIWNNPNVLSFHKQNIMLYVKKEKASLIKVSEDNFYVNESPMSLVHPEIFLSERNISKRIAYKVLPQKIINLIRKIRK
jgi:hypothetical protein